MMNKKYIHGLIVNNETIAKDIHTWSDDDYDNPIIVSENNSIENYENISNIENWFKLVIDYRLKYEQIKILFSDMTWESLSEKEKEIVSKLYLVEKEKRDFYIDENTENEKYNYFKIYNYISDDIYYEDIDIFKQPFSLDYKKDLKIRLHPKYIIDSRGLLEKVIYYEKLETSLDSQGFTQYDFENPILEYSAEYFFNSDSYLDKRIVHRKWYRLDGKLDPNYKESIKIYDGFQSRNEGRRRRQNLINQLLLDTVGLIIITSEDLDTVTQAEADALPLLKETASGISEYYEYGSKEDSNSNPCLLWSQVQNSSFPRLDNVIDEHGTTIRDFILMRILGDRIDDSSP